MVYLALISLVILFVTDVWGFVEVMKGRIKGNLEYVVALFSLIMYASLFSVVLGAI